MNDFYFLPKKEILGKNLKKYILFFISCVSFQYLTAQPVISSFNPAAGPVGTTVTITGMNFNPVSANNIVYFGAAKAAVLSGTNTSLTVTVPAGTTYQPITVTSNNLTAYSAIPFNVTFPGGGAITATSFTKEDYNLTNAWTESRTCDIDGDGKPDLIYSGENNITIFRSTTSGGIVSIGSRTDLPVGCGYGFSIGDVDGDGKPDIVAANGCDDFVVIYKNTSSAGNISFAARVEYSITADGFPYKVEVGDLDNDGRPDIALVNLYGRSLSIFKNTSIGGIISFAPKVDFITATWPRGLSFGDFNADGKTDIAVSNQGAASISIFRNTGTSGTISFAPRVDYPTAAPSGPESVLVADFDGDGKSDIALSNNNEMGTISIFRNLSTTGGNISFGPKMEYAAGNGHIPYSFAIADLDGDGKPDMAMANQNTLTITVFRNASTSGNISFASPVNYATSISGTRFITCADLNADGKPDMLLSGSMSTAISLYINKVDGPNITAFTPIAAVTNATVTITGTNFTGATAVSFGATPASSFTVVNATTIYAVVGAGTSGDVTVTTPLGTGKLAGFTYTGLANPVPTISSFTPASGAIGTSVTITGTNFSTTAADNIVYFGAVRAQVSSATSTTLTVTVPDGATYLPITVTTNGLTAYAVLPFKTTSTGGTISTGSFAKVDHATGNNPYSVYLSDFDTDGKPDIAVTNLSSNTVSVLKNQGTGGNISFAAKLDFPTGTQPFNCSAGDLDGDGKNDLAIANTGSNTISVLKNISSGTIAFAAKVDFPAGTTPRGVTIRDIDGDGKPDMVVANYGANTVSVFKNTSSGIGVISFASKVDYPAGSGPVNVTIADFDGDGKPDIALINISSNTISILRNTSTAGAISFAAKVDSPTGNTPFSISTGDLDGDGRIDIAIINQSSNTFSVYRNISSGNSISFTPKLDFPTEAGVSAISIGDLDGDGKPDVIVANDNISGSISIFKNSSSTGAISFLPIVNVATGSLPRSVAIGDINADGKPEVIVGNYNDNNISLLRNQITELTLPLSLLSFNVRQADMKISLQWKTENEQNTSHFVVEHSSDGILFSAAGRVNAAENSNTLENYSFIHVNPKNGVNYYRLKMVDRDGRFTYSQYISVEINNRRAALQVYPNPARTDITVEHPGFSDHTQLKVVDMTGKVMQIIKIDKDVIKTKVHLMGLMPGIYNLMWTNGADTLTQMLMVQ